MLTPELRSARKQARADKWPKCQSCGGRGEIRIRGVFAQTIGCDECGGVGFNPPLRRAARVELDRLAQMKRAN